jgi:hypothetical protein
MGSVHARGDTFLTFGLKALTETNTSRLATAMVAVSEHVSFLRGILVVIWSSDVADCEDF